jgi:predicted nucleotidyltransferase
MDGSSIDGAGCTTLRMRFDDDIALAANRDVFCDVENLQRISRYVKTGQFPWEGAA